MIKYLSILIFSLSVFSVPESKLTIIRSLFENQENYTLHKFMGEANLEVDYTKYGEKVGKRGAVIISVGNRQAGLEYLEMAFDLEKMGFSPIYMTSHRGQGFSDRALDDFKKGHVEHFSYYADDLNKLVQIVQSEIGEEVPLYNISHSMGGAITLDYLQRYKSAFKRVLLSAPMIKIRKDEDKILARTFFACYTPFGPSCDDYAPGTGKEETREFEGNIITSSKGRYDLRTLFIDMYPKYRLAGPTVRWIFEAIKANRKMRKKSKLERVSTPILIVQAGEDKVIVNEAHREICTKLKDCSLIQITGSLHDIPMERDIYRSQLMINLSRFFN